MQNSAARAVFTSIAESGLKPPWLAEWMLLLNLTRIWRARMCEPMSSEREGPR